MTDDHEFSIQEHCRTRSIYMDQTRLKTDKDETNINY